MVAAIGETTRTSVIPGSAEPALVTASLAAARDVPDFGTDVPGTLQWCVQVGHQAPRVGDGRTHELWELLAATAAPRCIRGANARAPPRRAEHPAPGRCDLRRRTHGRGPRVGASRSRVGLGGVRRRSGRRASRGARRFRGMDADRHEALVLACRAPDACAGHGIRRRRAAAPVRGGSPADSSDARRVDMPVIFAIKPGGSIASGHCSRPRRTSPDEGSAAARLGASHAKVMIWRSSVPVARRSIASSISSSRTRDDTSRSSGSRPERHSST